MKLSAKLGMMVSGAVLACALAVALLFGLVQRVTHSYDDILAGPQHDGYQARVMQVEFKKQVQEWKDILLRGYDPANLKKYTQQFHDESNKTDALADDLAKNGHSAVVRDKATQFRAAHNTLNASYQRAYDVFVAGDGLDFRKADSMVKGQDRPPTDLIDTLVAETEKASKKVVADQAKRVKSDERNVLIGLAILLVIVAVALVLVARSIVRPLRQLRDSAKRIAEGDVETRVAYRSRDEIGDLAEAFRTMTDYLRQVAGWLDELSAGNVAGDVASRGGQDVLGNASVKLQATLKHLVKDINDLTARAERGELGARVDSTRFQGAYAEITAGINATLEAVVNPMREAIRVLEKLAGRDLTANVEGSYAGDFQLLKESINTAIENLNAGFARVATAADQIADSAGSIDGFNRQLATAADVQNLSIDMIEETLTDLRQRAASGSVNGNLGEELGQIHAAIRQMADVTGSHAQGSEAAAVATQRLSDEASDMRELVGRFQLAQTLSGGRHGGDDSMEPDVEEAVRA